MEDLSSSSGFGTRAIHAGQPHDPLTGAVMTPIYQTTTYAQESPGRHKGYEYSRTGNPTRKAYEDCVASLENAKYGLAFSSGMAAMDCIVHTLKKGDHVVCCDDVYGGTFRLFDKVYSQLGLEFTFVDLTKSDALETSFRNNTKLVWIETPTNPLLKIIDIEAISKFARSKGAKTVVDNTFMSPYFQSPLQWGADVVVHSVTKFMNGHSDVVGGVLCTNDKDLCDQLAFMQNSVGGIPSPHDCFLVLRGLKTLHVRMQRHEENAKKVVDFLTKNNSVDSVIYPGLDSHPQYAVAKKQMTGFGGMISFRVKGGLSEAKSFLERVQIFALAESLGGVESLTEHPAIMTHASIPADKRAELGITDNLIRLSVGIEDATDLISDLSQALG